MRRLLALGLALALALLPAMPVLSASEAGSHGWSRERLVLRSGPGGHYDVTGEIAGEVAIKILRCHKIWCNVDGPDGRGWTYIGALDFGKNPHWPLFDGDNQWLDLEGGAVCFFEGSHFTGRSFCADSGDVFLDLATLGWDNRIGSIEVTVDTSAAVCRDRNLQSYCERIVSSQPVLDPLLVRNLSSIRVY
jgi:hypothetical protein